MERNLDTVRRIYAQLSAGDRGAFDSTAPDLVVDFSRRLVDPISARI